MNALIDALSEYGIRHIDMPATPERVWRAIRQCSRGLTPVDRYYPALPTDPASVGEFSPPSPPSGAERVGGGTSSERRRGPPHPPVRCARAPPSPPLKRPGDSGQVFGDMVDGLAQAQLVPVVHRRDPRAPCSDRHESGGAARVGGPCGPTGASVLGSGSRRRLAQIEGADLMSAKQDVETPSWSVARSAMRRRAKARPSLSGRLRKLSQPSASTRRTIAPGPSQTFRWSPESAVRSDASAPPGSPERAPRAAAECCRPPARHRTGLGTRRDRQRPAVRDLIGGGFIHSLGRRSITVRTSNRGTELCNSARRSFLPIIRSRPASWRRRWRSAASIAVGCRALAHSGAAAHAWPGGGELPKGYYDATTRLCR